jgi:hypothetical protein
VILCQRHDRTRRRDGLRFIGDIESGDLLRQFFDCCRDAFHAVPFGGKALKDRVQRCRYVEERRCTEFPQTRRKVVDHQRHALFGIRLAPQTHPSGRQTRRARQAIRCGDDPLLVDCAKRHRCSAAVHFRQVVHDHRLHRRDAMGMPVLNLLHLQRLHDHVRHIDARQQVDRRLAGAAPVWWNLPVRR